MKKLFILAVTACTILSSCSSNNEIDNNLPNDEIIQFADPIVKEICIKMWDMDNDNQLSIGEAKTVKSLGLAFSDNRDIRQFNELKYFVGLSAIDDKAFYRCTNLEEIELPASINYIGESAFYNTYVKNVVIPNSVLEIGEFAFSGSAIENIILPNKLSVIRKHCLSSSRIKSINVPSSVKLIEEYAFFNTCMESVKLAEGLLEIEDYAFYHNYNTAKRFAKIELPASIITLGNNIFGMGDDYNDFSYSPLIIYCKSSTPISFTSRSNTLGAGIDKIYVPNPSVSAYKSARVWKQYSNIITGF